MKKLDIKTEILYDTLGSNKCIVHYPVIASPQSFATISINNFSKFHAENFINIGATRLGTSRIVKIVKAMEEGKEHDKQDTSY